MRSHSSISRLLCRNNTYKVMRERQAGGGEVEEKYVQTRKTYSMIGEKGIAKKKKRGEGYNLREADGKKDSKTAVMRARMNYEPKNLSRKG